MSGHRTSATLADHQPRREVPRDGRLLRVLDPEALTWLGRYLRTFEGPVAGPLWRTMRGKSRPLTYGAARRVLQRANDTLGTNWTLHDLRHTAATRMVSSGVLTLPEMQVVQGHADLRTTSIYTVPRSAEKPPPRDPLDDPTGRGRHAGP